MGTVILYCRLCAASYGSVGDIPVHCPSCHRPTKWGASPPSALTELVDGWEPNVNDKRFLRSLKIDPE